MIWATLKFKDGGNFDEKIPKNISGVELDIINSCFESIKEIVKKHENAAGLFDVIYEDNFGGWFSYMETNLGNEEINLIKKSGLYGFIHSTVFVRINGEFICNNGHLFKIENSDKFPHCPICASDYNTWKINKNSI